MDIIATGAEPKHKFAVGKGISFETDHPNIAVGLVNNYHAFKGYSYLLISNGFGCMATILFEGFEDLNKYFKLTINEFSLKFELNKKNLVNFSGFGSFSNQIRKKENQMIIGEKAGLQDLLWGFGIRNAVKSGFIASKIIIEDREYKEYYNIAENYFKPKFNSGIVNRFIWETFASSNYSLILNRIHYSKDPLKYLNSIYNFNLLQKLTFPVALFYMKYRYPNIKL
jgi:flavin-dependent dehydrogenase